jgi:hypothetical protein
MLQYDRATGAFVVSEGDHAMANLDYCAKLNQNLEQIHEWLNLKRSIGRYSHGFLVELAIHATARFLDIHAIYDAIGRLEGTDLPQSMTKKSWTDAQ